jgi:hypothetical protein
MLSHNMGMPQHMVRRLYIMHPHLASFTLHRLSHTSSRATTCSSEFIQPSRVTISKHRIRRSGKATTINSNAKAAPELRWSGLGISLGKDLYWRLSS